MPIDAKLYRVLIASPRDTEKERNIIREEISRWNSMNAESLAIVFLPTGWETGAPDLKEPGQAVINRQLVDNCDLLIGTFRTLIGTKTAEFESGTVEEIERARAKGKRCIVYFYENPSVVIADKEQYERLLQYKEELKTRGLISLYRTLPDFRKKVLAHITNAIQELAKEDRERKAAENEARITEQAIGLPSQENLKLQSSNVDFTTLANSQITIKYLLESRFGIQYMEDAREKEIAKIKNVLSSPELAAHFGSYENVPAVVQIIETVSMPSLFAISSIGKYGDGNTHEWVEIVGEWIEDLSKPRSESGYAWTINIKQYPGLLAFYVLGISILRSRKISFLKNVIERQVYSYEYGGEINLISSIYPLQVFYDNTDKLIELGFTKRYTPVSDHLATFIKDNLYPNEELKKYWEWFDLFEFLICLKSFQLNGGGHYGSFTYRTDTRGFIFNSIQEAVLSKSRLGVAILELFDGIQELEKCVQDFDSKVSKIRDYGRFTLPQISGLIKLAKSTQKIIGYSEWVNHQNKYN
jgi:hypothetical protein